MDPDASPRGTATHTTNEFLKGSQFAACLTEITSPVSSVSSVRSGTGPSVETLDPGAASVLRKVQTGLRTRGIQALVELGRCLRLNDADGDGKLALGEFPLKNSGVHITGRDAQSLFYHFDSNHDGAMSVNEFLSEMREPMNPRRQLVVRMAFDALDLSGSGELPAAVIATTFDARRLPEVSSGRKTDCEAHAEFLDTFGLVTERQRQRNVNFDVWERYYANVSAAINEDDQFEQMVRNAWHI
eukprot:jgi/Phyca11/126370/e_gw1.62.271.1